MELNGTPREFLENPDLVELLLPRVRQDFLLDETYEPNYEYEPLNCPISAFGGTEDRDVPEESLRAWSTQTRCEFALTMFTGADHFFIQSKRNDLIGGIRRLLKLSSQELRESTDKLPASTPIESTRHCSGDRMVDTIRGATNPA